MPTTIAVLIADDHALLCESLRHYLVTATEGIRVVATALSGGEAVEAAIRHHPDVALLDVDISGLSAFEVARSIRDRSPPTRIVFTASVVIDRELDQALLAGCAGFVLKTDTPAVLASAIKGVQAGTSYFSHDVRDRMQAAPESGSSSEAPRSRISTLTERELEVLRYLAQGLAKKQIAETVNLSIGTVNNHVSHLMQKLDIHDRVLLARFAIREGLILP